MAARTLAGMGLFLLAMMERSPSAMAQGNSGSITGTVQSSDGASLEGAIVQVRNTATGFVVDAQVHHKRFLVHGLEPGGPYTVLVRRIGYLPQQIHSLTLTLGEPLELDIVLQPAATPLDSISVSAPETHIHTGGGATTTIPDALVRRLPTLNRNFYDFVVLAPLVSTKVGSGRTGISGAGANLRFNSFQINGADERLVNGSLSAAANVGKSIPLDAVKEYQVLIAPYDIRYGDFAGAMINTVTQSGTNQLRGSAFGYWRNDALARSGGEVGETPYDRLQFGFSAGGPIVKNRLHFFVAPEIQRLSEPALGPYLGQPAGQLPGVPVSETDITRLQGILSDRYGLSAGSGGYVKNGTPLVNLFARLDGSLPSWKSRAVGFVTYASSNADNFSRSSSDVFPLSSYKYATVGGVWLGSVQLHTEVPRSGGGHNQLSFSVLSDWTDQLPVVRQPLVKVVTAATGGGLVTLNAGSAELAQGRFGRDRSLKLGDEINLPLGSHHVLVSGLQLERFRVLRGGITGGYGIWTFASLDALQAGTPDKYELRKDFGSASVPLHGGQYAAYFGDEWRVGRRVSLSLGIRADRFAIDGHAPYNPSIDSIFGRRTDRMPDPALQWSPRAGFVWDISATRRERLHGGAGMFTGRPPLAWLVPALANYGEGIGSLTCSNLPTDAGLPPPFEPDYRKAPTQCATGAPLEARRFGDVDLLDRHLRMAQAFRATLGYERELPGAFIASTDVQLSWQRSDFIWVNLNLQGPQSVDRFGRVMYGTINPSGVATPALRSSFAEVIDLQNTGRNVTYQIAGRVERRVRDGLGVSLAYTYSRSRDVQSPSRVNLRGTDLWADARPVSGRHDQLRREVSLNDLPHRIVAALTYSAPWRHWLTDVAFHYVGESGSPFTYLATGANRRGDLNADGSNANDPIYVPRNAADPNEILFDPYVRQVTLPGGGVGNETVTPADQAAALEHFIERTPCLRRQRGQFAPRNSCREPWTHTTVASLRQGIPLGGRVLEAEIDAFNLIHLVKASWGLFQTASPRLLEQVRQTAGSPQTSQPVFRYDTARAEWVVLPEESAFQLQVALRYRF